MDKSARIRWTVLLSSLAATIAAIVYPVDEPRYQIAAASPAAKPPAPRSQEKAVAMQSSAEQPREIWIASDDNPFAPRAWQPTPPPAPEAPRPAPAPAPEPIQTVELAPPPLPYRFLGQMQDGGKRVLYLGRGEQVVLAHQGDVLEDSYKVVSIGDSQIEFESVQSGIRQVLPISAQ